MEYCVIVYLKLRYFFFLVVVPDGYICACPAVQDTSCKIVIMCIHCSRDIDILSFVFVSACTYTLPPFFMQSYFASSDSVLCLVSIYMYMYLYSVLHSLQPMTMLLIFYTGVNRVATFNKIQ